MPTLSAEQQEALYAVTHDLMLVAATQPSKAVSMVIAQSLDILFDCVLGIPEEIALTYIERAHNEIKSTALETLLNAPSFPSCH